jgi:hypothetical protein
MASRLRCSSVRLKVFTAEASAASRFSASTVPMCWPRGPLALGLCELALRLWDGIRHLRHELRAHAGTGVAMGLSLRPRDGLHDRSSAAGVVQMARLALINGGAAHRHHPSCRPWPKMPSRPPRLSATARRIASNGGTGSPARLFHDLSNQKTAPSIGSRNYPPRFANALSPGQPSCRGSFRPGTAAVQASWLGASRRVGWGTDRLSKK